MMEYVMFPIGNEKYVRMKFYNIREENMFLADYLAFDSVAYVICCGCLIGAYAMDNGVVTYTSYM